MRCNRSIYRQDWFKVSNRRICRDIGVDQPDQMCRKMTLRNFHKLIWNQAPPQLYKHIKFNNRHRGCSKISLSYPTSKQVSKRTVLENGLDLFNDLPSGLKFMNHKKLKTELAKISI